jgi:hypothetical protein
MRRASDRRCFRRLSGTLLLQTYNGSSVPDNVFETCELTTMCTQGHIHPDPAGYADITNTLLPLAQTAITSAR